MLTLQTSKLPFQKYLVQLLHRTIRLSINVLVSILVKFFPSDFETTIVYLCVHHPYAIILGNTYLVHFEANRAGRVKVNKYWHITQTANYRPVVCITQHERHTEEDEEGSPP